jgi:DNA-binding XRE family transcriptional regulator
MTNPFKIEILHQRYVKGNPKMETLLDEERTHAEIAAQIYQMRTEAGLSQRALAKKIDTSASVICRLENADYDGHSLAMLRRIASALNKRVKVIFEPLEETLSH